MDQELLGDSQLSDQLPPIMANIQNIAEQNKHDEVFLLSVLRNLEAIHRHIRTNLFEQSLPTTRNDLYNLVREIEEQGGWPYIERMKLQELIQNMDRDFSVDRSDT